MTAPTRLDARATDRALATPGSPEVTGFYDEYLDVVDWAPGKRKFTPWVCR